VNESHYKSFVVRMLITEEGQIHSTTVQSVGSVQQQRWPGWDPAALIAFIETHALGAPGTVGSAWSAQDEAAPDSLAEWQLERPREQRSAHPAAVTISPWQQRRCALEPFNIVVRLDLEEIQPPPEPGSSYTAVVFADPVEGGPIQIVARAGGPLDVEDPAITLTSGGLPPGTYRVEAVVNLLEPTRKRPRSLAAVIEHGLLLVEDGDRRPEY
jgi:hypothetical protein